MSAVIDVTSSDREQDAAAPQDAAKQCVLLVVPPFQTTTTPALGVSQLKANLDQAGIPTRVSYLNLRFAERIGLKTYERIGLTSREMVGEFIFSDLIFQQTDEDVERYVKQVLPGTSAEKYLSRLFPGKALSETLRQLMQEAADFYTGEALEQLLSFDPWLVGLSSSFQQNCPSVALINLLKMRRPDIVTAMGGANCASVMGKELFARFPNIDYIGQGECDYTFVELLRSLRNGEKDPVLPGILTRTNELLHLDDIPLQSEELERMPYPDFDDYFEQGRKSSLAANIAPALLMETSRGCWWGAKHHCTFCGLNAEGMAFRRKSEARTLSEMRDQSSRYQTTYFQVVDNILDMKFFKTLIPSLIEQPAGEFFFETKSNLNKLQVKQLAHSGIKWIQPGIESMSDRSLRLMRKGCTKTQNIQLLKWCAEYGVDVLWNHLYGFAGEHDEDVAEIAEDVEALHHLRPPGGTGTIRVVRFSPYFNEPDEFGLDPIYPAEPYHHVYPFPEESLRRLAYFYECDFVKQKATSKAYKDLQAILDRWKRAFPRSYLLAIPNDKNLLILDTRPCARRLWRRLDGAAREIYEFCDRSRGFNQIRNLIDSEDDQSLKAILDTFVRDKLMLHYDGHYLSLAVDPTHGFVKYVPSPRRRALRAVEPGSRQRWLRGVRWRRFQSQLKMVLTLSISPPDLYTEVVERSSRRLITPIASRIIRRLVAKSQAGQAPRQVSEL